MPQLDTGVERLSPAMPRRLAVGCFLIPAMLALSSTDLGIAVTPGTVVLDDHAVQINGRDDLAVNDGKTLTDLSEIVSDVVAYWNPAASVAQVIVVDGAEALTSAGAEAPSDDDVEDALPDSSYPWIRLGRVKFSRSGSTITLDYIDHGVRPLEVTSARKAVGTSSSSHETDVVGDDAQLYEYAGEVAFEVDAADLAAADVVTDYPLPLFYGKIGRTRAVVTKAITTAAKAADLDFEIGAAALTGGQIALAGTYALGAVEEGSAITDGETFKPGDKLSVVGSAVTAFVEGRVKIVAEVYRLVT